MLLVACGWCFTHRASAQQVDEKREKKAAPKKEKKDEDKKTEGIRRAQTATVGPVTGKVCGVDEKSIKLEVGEGQRKRNLDILLAEDVIVRLPAEREFDEKGRLKPPKKDPSDKDRKYGGIKGSKDDLKDGQGVVVKLGKYKQKLVATVIVVMEEKK
jgi:hypothetical protein